MTRYETVFGMDSDRQRIAGELVKDEMKYRRMTNPDMAVATRTSPATVAKAKRGEMSDLTAAQIERAFGWHRGFLRAVLLGDVNKISSYETTDEFPAYIRDSAVEQLRRVAMVVPIREDKGGEAAGNGNGR